jgi:SAM-dependent methyltransferase
VAFYQHFALRKKNPLGVWVHRRQAKKLAELVRMYAGASAKILEIGPGDGYLAVECTRAGFSYKAIDGSPEVAKQIREKGFDIQTAFVPPIPMAVGNVDVCCLFHVLEHMIDGTQAEQLIRETRRVLVPGGLLVLACPNYYTWGRDFYESDYSHNYVTTPRRARQLLEDSGYTVLAEQFYSGPLFGNGRYATLLANRLLYWKWLNRIMRSERYYRAFLTFLECFVLVARSERLVDCASNES